MFLKTVAQCTDNAIVIGDTEDELSLTQKAFISSVVGTVVRWVFIPVQQATSAALAVPNVTFMGRLQIGWRSIRFSSYTLNPKVWLPWVGSYGGAGLAKFFTEASLAPVIGRRAAVCTSVLAAALVDGLFSACNELQLEMERLMKAAMTPQQQTAASRLTKCPKSVIRAVGLCTLRGIPSAYGAFATEGLGVGLKLGANAAAQSPGGIVHIDHLRSMQRVGRGGTVRPLVVRAALFFRRGPVRVFSTLAMAPLTRIGVGTTAFCITMSLEYAPRLRMMSIPMLNKD